MKFCPKCETRLRLKFDTNEFTCLKCGFSSSNNTDNQTKIEEKQDIDDKQNVVKIMENDESSEGSLPTINIDCPKCKNNNAYWWMFQTRSADEATTQFYRCTKCKHTWRNYA